jgi:hypothetical protein
MTLEKSRRLRFPSISHQAYTVDIFSGEPGESAQLRFALKNFVRISSDLDEFRPLFEAEEFADLGKFRSNRKKFARNFWGET